MLIILMKQYIKLIQIFSTTFKEMIQIFNENVDKIDFITDLLELLSQLLKCTYSFANELLLLNLIYNKLLFTTPLKY